MQELIPKWVWWPLILGTGALAGIILLASVFGIGGSIVANLVPEGALDGSLNVPSQIQGPINASVGPEQILPPFGCDYVESNRNHVNKDEVAYVARDYVPAKTCTGTPYLYAPISGVVEVQTEAENLNVGYGNNFVIRGEETRIRMAHCADRPGESFAFVRNGDKIEAGTPLCVMGSTGNSTGPHLHIETYVSGVAVAPESILPEFGAQYASNFKGIGEGILRAAPMRNVALPGPVKSALNWFAGLGQSAGELPDRALGRGTTRDSQEGKVHVQIQDERVDKSKVDPSPDARKIAKKISEAIPEFSGEMKIVFVDRICVPEGCYASRVASSSRIEIDPGHQDVARDGMDLVLSQSLANLKSNIEPEQNGEPSPQDLSQFSGLTTGSDKSKDKSPKPDELVTYVFTQPGDQGTEVLRPQIERLRQSYPWVSFEFIDATLPSGRGLAQDYQVTSTPTTVLTRAGREVWTWKGGISGLEDLLILNRQLGEMMMAQGQVPWLGSVDLPNVTYAGVYGNLCSKVGTLGLTCSVEEALGAAAKWGGWVKDHNGGKTVVNVLIPTYNGGDAGLIREIIAETTRRNSQGEHWYVLLNLEGGSEESVKRFADEFVQPQYPSVGIVMDLEWFGRSVPISEINRIAKYYFDLRSQRGLTDLGIFACWFFKAGSVKADERILSEYVASDASFSSNSASGIAVPIMDGFGGRGAKIGVYNRMKELFGSRYNGMMSFTWRWGNKYDQVNPEDLFTPEMFFWTQQ